MNSPFDPVPNDELDLDEVRKSVHRKIQHQVCEEVRKSVHRKIQHQVYEEAKAAIPNHAGASGSAIRFDNPLSSSTQVGVYLPNGEKLEWDVTLTIKESVHSNDSFWEEKLDPQIQKRAVRINHRHYTLGSGDKPASSSGFGGSPFRVRMLDTGRVIDTRDLWYQGVIPPAWRERLPDNAEWGKPWDQKAPQ